MKKNILAMRKFSAFLLALAMILMNLSINVFAVDSSTNSELDISEFDTDTIVTYNVETQEVTYDSYRNIKESNATSNFNLENVAAPSSLFPIMDTTDSPYRNVCYIVATFPNGKVATGSGTLVYFDILLTAAHVVYSNENGGWATTVTVTPGRTASGSAPFGSTTSTLITAHNEWINNANSNYDWAVVDLAGSFSTWQLYGYYSDYYNEVGDTVTFIGYPGNVTSAMCTDEGPITSINEYRMHCSLVADYGMSGGAIIDNKSGYLIGVITAKNSSGTVGIGVRITQLIGDVILSRRD